MKDEVKLTLCGLVVGLLLVACAATILKPKDGEFPCGVNGTNCGHHMCCDAPFTVCGGPFTGCAEGMCCYSPDVTVVGRSLGEAKGVPQRAEGAR